MWVTWFMSNNPVTHSGFLEIVDVIFEHMKNNLLKLLLLSLILTSCASYNYDYHTTNDGSIQIKADNQKRFEVVTKYDSKIIADGSGLIFTKLPNLKKKSLTLLLICDNYDTVELRIKRAPRTDVLIKDMCLGVLPLFIDVFKSDFYRISKESKSLDVHFEFSQSFMASEFKKIRFSKDPRDFDGWIKNYSNSRLLDSVVQIKDSLELSIAISKESEDAIVFFIMSHPNSKFLIKANEIHDAMIEAREHFEIAKSENTIEAFESFLDDYPNSLQNRDAHTKLVRLAEKKALTSGNIGVMIDYLNTYLIPHSEFLYDFEQNNRAWSFTKAIDEQLIIENKKNNQVDNYENYSALWKSCEKIKQTVPTSYLRTFEKVESSKTQIFKLIFPQLQENNSIGQQQLLLDRINVDFPNMTNGMSNRELMISIIESSDTKTGILKVWDVGYVPYLFQNNKIIYPNIFAGREKYFWDGKYLGSLLNFEINYEEISFLNGEIFGVTKCFVGDKVKFDFDIGESGPKQISYYQEGKLIKQTTFSYIEDAVKLPFGYKEVPNLKEYSYEFENGVNITLKKLETTEKEAIEMAKSGLFDDANNILKLALNKNFPETIIQIANLNRALSTVEKMKQQYLNKLEAQRLVNERKQRELELAEEKRQQKIRIAEENRQKQIALQEELARLQLLNTAFQYLNDRNTNGKCKVCRGPFRGKGWCDSDKGPEQRGCIFYEFCSYDCGYKWWVTHHR